MTPAQIEAAKTDLTAFFQANADRMGYLWGRWQDEKEYEAFAEYSAEYKKLCDTKPELTFKKASKSPMGFTAHYAPIGRDVQFICNGSRAGWKVVPAKK